MTLRGFYFYLFVEHNLTELLSEPLNYLLLVTFGLLLDSAKLVS